MPKANDFEMLKYNDFSDELRLTLMGQIFLWRNFYVGFNFTIFFEQNQVLHVLLFEEKFVEDSRWRKCVLIPLRQKKAKDIGENRQ